MSYVFPSVKDRVENDQLNIACIQIQNLMDQLASRQALSSCPEIPDSSVTGNAVATGELIDELGEFYKRSILIQFANVEDFGAAVKSGQCRFTVFVGL